MSFPTVNTKLFFLLGNPLGHSISPAMHNRVFSALSMDCCYMPVEVDSADLEQVFKGLIRMHTGGMNVTVPHKMQIMEYLDELDPLAAAIGAVNTICLNDGKTKGYNTDGEGFIQSLENELSFTVQGKRIFILGCGGAARSISMTLANKGAEKVFICNRTQEKAAILAKEINEKIAPCAQVTKQSTTAMKKDLPTSDLLINCTSIGMHPHVEEIPLDPKLLFKELVVADIVYNPLETGLLKAARGQGCHCLEGLGMLVYQGAAAFKLWTGIDPLIELMSDTVYSLMTTRK